VRTAGDPGRSSRWAAMQLSKAEPLTPPAIPSTSVGRYEYLCFQRLNKPLTGAWLEELQLGYGQPAEVLAGEEIHRRYMLRPGPKQSRGGPYRGHPCCSP